MSTLPRLLLPFLLAVPLLAQSPTVVINEFVYDDTGTDDREFVELLNVSAAPIDISNWRLESRDPGGANPTYTIPPSTILAAGDYWVIGAATVANVDQVVGTTNLWENDNESLTLYDAVGRRIDTLVYEAHRGVWDRSLAEREGLWGDHISEDVNPTSWSRVPNGRDQLEALAAAPRAKPYHWRVAGSNGLDFRLAPITPGASNDQPVRSAWSESFDGFAIDAPIPDWSGSNGVPHAIDPTTVSTHNPSAFPASPQGGKAVVFRTGAGGNIAWLSDAGGTRMSFEAWVWFDASAAATPRGFSLGVCGTSSTPLTPANPGSPSNVANGNTGVSWTYLVSGSVATLYLIDHGDGGWGAGALDAATVLGQVTIQAGNNDGWQRLRLVVEDGRVVARFGGTVGAADGTLFTARAQPTFGGVYVRDRSTGITAMAMDGVDIRMPYISIGGSGCQGNCPALNENATSITDVVADEASYAFALDNDSADPITIDHLCYLTRSTGGNAAVSVEVRARMSNGFPGEVLASAALTVGPALAWYQSAALNHPVPANTKVFIVLVTSTSIYRPVADAWALGLPEPASQYFKSGDGGGNWAQQDEVIHWAARLVCPDDKDVVKIDVDAQLKIGSPPGPMPGGAPNFEFEGAVPSASAFLALGVARSSPIPLDALGAPTCVWSLVIADAIGTVADGAGRGSVPLAVPNDPTLVGARLITQWLVLRPGANLLGLAMSPELEQRITY